MKYYYYHTSDINAHKVLNEFFQAYYEKEIVHVRLNEKIGYMLADDDFYDVIDNILSLFIHDTGYSLTFIASHDESETALYFLEKACLFCNERCSYLSDVLLACMLADVDTSHILKKQFSHISHEEIQCALMYVNCGLSITRASRKLFIHRNTFTYRMNKFIHASNLDIREFHNAMYFSYAMKVIF